MNTTPAPRPAMAAPGRPHRVRAAFGLVVVALCLGLLLAAVLGGLTWAVSLALHAAAKP